MPLKRGLLHFIGYLSPALSGDTVQRLLRRSICLLQFALPCADIPFGVTSIPPFNNSSAYGRVNTQSQKIVPFVQFVSSALTDHVQQVFVCHGDRALLIVGLREQLDELPPCDFISSGLTCDRSLHAFS